MRRNVEINGLGPTPPVVVSGETSADSAQNARKADDGKVRVNEGDAWSVFYLCVGGQFLKSPSVL